MCGLTGGQTEGAAGCRQPGWTPREPHGHCGYGLRPGKHQPAEFHRYTRGRGQGIRLRTAGAAYITASDGGR